MKYEIPQMLKQGKGSIVNASSAAGLIGAQSNPAYTGSKHGVIGLTKMAAIEFARKGIRVNCICPGPTTTTRMNEELAAACPDRVEEIHNTVPMGRTAEPREIAEAAVWLCSDKASYVTGAALPVDGGVVAE
jgi:NAD(P)-dependent dehydrogenase (short-subunit alcohol dehydrogenase family)